ncbi:MAG: acyltransferase [Gemmatimonadales bacterium]
MRALAKKLLMERHVRKFFGAIFTYLRRCQQWSYEQSVRARYAIDPTVRWEEGTLLFGEGSITLGEGTYLGHDCHVSSHPAAAKIAIGKYCAIAHGIHIRTTDYARVPEFKDAVAMEPEWADIVIGDYCWIGSHVYICSGVTIGDNCIIGANSVVTHDVEPNTVVGGVPARLIHHKSVYANRPSD